MIEKYGNMWYEPADALVITTNGIIKGNGEAVMGAGIALQAKTKYPSLPRELARRLGSGNHTYLIPQSDGRNIVTFPTKHDWRDKSDLNLIKQSAEELVELADANDWTCVVMPKPGCANGMLSWIDVKAVIDPILDDRFIVVDFR